MAKVIACLALFFLTLTGILPLASGDRETKDIIGRYIRVVVRGGDDCLVTSYGAKGDGKTNDTAAVQRALDVCNGTVVVPSPKTFLVAALAITRSATELRIEEGATLLVSDDRLRWPGSRHVISARGVDHIAITGSGTIDGQGLNWWRHRDDFRPHTVDFAGVRNAILSDTLYLNAPNHVLELGCDNCELSGVRVVAPPSTGECEKEETCSHNTDAVDIHGSPFYIHDVNFTTGDDNVAAHANHTIVEDSYFGTGHGASIGSLCGAWLHNITFRNISFRKTTAGSRIKSHPKCAGKVWDVTYEDLVMHEVDQAIDLTQHYDGKGHSTYAFVSVAFRRFRVYGGGKSAGEDKGPAVVFDCDNSLPGGSNCEVELDDLDFEGYGDDAGMSCAGVRGSAKGLRGVASCIPTLSL